VATTTSASGPPAGASDSAGMRYVPRPTSSLPCLSPSRDRTHASASRAASVTDRPRIASRRHRPRRRRPPPKPRAPGCRSRAAQPARSIFPRRRCCLCALASVASERPDAPYIRNASRARASTAPGRTGRPEAGRREATLGGVARRCHRGGSTPGEPASPPRCRSRTSNSRMARL